MYPLPTRQENHQARHPRRRQSIFLAVVSGGLAFFIPLIASAQQPARPDLTAFCKTFMSYMAQHPEIDEALAKSRPVKLAPSARQSLVAAMVQRRPDSAAAVLRPLIPDTSDTKIFAGITRLFQAIAALPDTEQIGRAIRMVADDADFTAFKFAAEVPDTLFTGIVAAAAADPQAQGAVCTDANVTPPASGPDVDPAP